MFGIELVFNIVMSLDIDEIFDFENSLLVIIIFEIVWTNTNNTIYSIFYVLHVLFSHFILEFKIAESYKITIRNQIIFSLHQSIFSQIEVRRLKFR
jgi:hypothetical protein